MRDDVHGTDIGSEDDDTDGTRGSGSGGFAERFDDFFDAALESTVRGSCR